MAKKSLIKNLKELEKFSLNFLEKIKEKEDREKPQIIKLSGDLGSGKTTFVQNVAKNLKIREKLSSPTFTISKIYKIPKNDFTDKKRLIHIDAYRLGEDHSLKNIGLDTQIKDPQNLIFIEWPEIIDHDPKLPKSNKGHELCSTRKNISEINFKYISENEREIIF